MHARMQAGKGHGRNDQPGMDAGRERVMEGVLSDSEGCRQGKCHQRSDQTGRFAGMNAGRERAKEGSWKDCSTRKRCRQVC